VAADLAATSTDPDQPSAQDPLGSLAPGDDKSENLPVTFLFVAGFAALAVALFATSQIPRRWLERRYWRRQQQNR
jgi:hypothetical protein